MGETAPFERGRTDGPEELRLRIPGASAEYLRGAVENPDMGPEETVLVLRNRALPAASLQRIARDRRWIKVYEVKLGLARHPRAPHAVARGLLGHLFWRDLMDLAADPRIAPPLRRDAERLLCIRLPELTLGERIALARRAGPGVIPALRESTDTAVLRALFGNGRFAEKDAVAVASSEGAPPQALATLAEHDSWGRRREVRMALLGNPRTPIPSALRLVEKLSREDLNRTARNVAMPRIVRVAAERGLERARLRRGDSEFG